MHTTYSDGFLSVDELLKVAEKSVDYIAITDHDSIDGALEAYQKIDNYNLKLVLGVELSTYNKNESVHILGYFKNVDDMKKIADFLSEQKKIRSDRCLEIAKRLKMYYGLDLDTSRLMKRSCVTRGSIAHEMVRQGMPYTVQEIFEKFIGDDCKAYIPSSKISTLDGIKILRDAGAIIVLAHPVRFKINNPQEIIDMSVDGMEARYSINTKAQTERYLSLAKKNNLFVTAGSDFHYFNDSEHGDIGCVYIEGDELQEFIKRVRG